MKEYWLNVYESGYVGHKFNFKPHWNKDSMCGKVIYRIHVKMKEPKPKYEEEKIYNYVGNKYAVKGFMT